MIDGFSVKVEPEKWCANPAVNLQTTHNGLAWTSMQFESVEEVNQTIKALQDFLVAAPDFLPAVYDRTAEFDRFINAMNCGIGDRGKDRPKVIDLGPEPATEKYR